MRRVVVTGLDCLTSLGSTSATWDGILGGRFAYGPLPSDYPVALLRSKQVSFLSDFRPAPEIGAIRADVHVHLAATCAIQALRDAGLDLRGLPEDRVGVIVGSGTGAAAVTERQVIQFVERSKVHPLTVPMVTLNALSGQLAILLNARGPNLTVSTACSSGNQAISVAYDAIRNGQADVVVSGASESPTTAVTFAAFDSMRVMAPEDMGCHPFSLYRSGFVLGEGAGILILESLEHALARGADIYGEITGYGSTCDAYHMVFPDPEGDHAERTMRMALAAAGLTAREVDYINAHGTATTVGDQSEAAGIAKLFGGSSASIPLVSSIKGAIGHTLGASGAIEAVVSLLAMRHQLVPPTVNFTERDESLPIDVVAGSPVRHPLRVILSNSFGFGGNNSTLVFQRYEG